MKQSNNFAIYPYLPILIGALLGAALGYFGQCSSGTCPLASTWWRGAIYGGFMGVLFALSSSGQRSRVEAGGQNKFENQRSGEPGQVPADFSGKH